MFIGIDGGGTSVKVLGFSDFSGPPAYRRTYPEPGNFLAIGPGGLESLLFRVLSDVGCSRMGEVSLLLGLAGSASVEAKSKILEVCRSLGLVEERVTLRTDAELAMIAVGESGILLISGTGAVCIGRHAGTQVISGGWGYLIDSDAGSGFFMGSTCLAYLSRHADGLNMDEIGSAKDLDELTNRILAYFGEKSGRAFVALTEIRPYVYVQGKERDTVAALAPLVFAACADGNGVARRIVERTASSLAELLVSVQTRLQLRPPFTIGLYGGLFRASDKASQLTSALRADERVVKIFGECRFDLLEESAEQEGGILGRAMRRYFLK